MLAQKHYQIRQSLLDQGIVFCYSGCMTESILSGIGHAIKQKLALENIDTKTVRGVFSIFVEQMQNVIRYSAEREPENGPEDSVLSFGLLTVGREDDSYFVTCGNKVQIRDVERLKSQLTNIQTLDAEGLKMLYKQILKGETPEHSKGAGVGFVDIARKSSRPVQFAFMDLDQDYSYFSFKAYIDMARN